MKRIAILATEFIRPQIEKCLAKLDLGFDYRIYCCRPLTEDITAAWAAIPEDVDGVLTCSTLFAQVLQKTFPDDPRVICPFDIDDAALFRLYVKLLDAGQLRDLSRIYSDFLENMHVDLHTFLTMEHEIPLSDAMRMDEEQCSTEGLRALEAEQYEKLLRVWETGTVDLIITRFSGLVPPLRERGVPMFYPYPNLDSIKKACLQLLRDIDRRSLEDNLPCAIHVNIWTAEPGSATKAAFEQRCTALQAALTDFVGDTLDHVVQRQHFGCEILTGRREAAKYTENFTRCSISAYLAQRLDFKTYIGYGIGRDIYQARLNAINAVREADITGKSHIITEKEELIGPLGSEDVLKVPITPAIPRRRITHTGLSSLTISKILTILSEMPNKQITAQELALKLSITRRGANYFLKAMTTAGILRVVSERRASTRGRPEQVYAQAPEVPEQDA